MRRQSTWLKNFLKSQLLLSVFLIVVLIFLSWPLAANLNKRSRLDREIEQLKVELARNQAQNNDFKKMIEYLDSDQFALEQAKLNLNLKKDGEKVVSIKDLDVPQESGQVMEVAPVETELKAPFSVRSRTKLWLDYFFGQS